MYQSRPNRAAAEEMDGSAHRGLQHISLDSRATKDKGPTKSERTLGIREFLITVTSKLSISNTKKQESRVVRVPSCAQQDAHLEVTLRCLTLKSAAG